MRDYYTISDLTEEFGISTRSLRYYEDQGLLKPLRRGRQRLYRPRERTRLKLILRGKRLGLSLADIGEIIDMYRKRPGEAGQLDLLLNKINERREELLQKQKDIELTLAELDEVEAGVRERKALMGSGGTISSPDAAKAQEI